MLPLGPIIDGLVKLYRVAPTQQMAEQAAKVCLSNLHRIAASQQAQRLAAQGLLRGAALVGQELAAKQAAAAQQAAAAAQRAATQRAREVEWGIERARIAALEESNRNAQAAASQANYTAMTQAIGQVAPDKPAGA